MEGQAQKDKKRSIEELYNVVQKQPEVIPNDVTEYFLRRSGFSCDDPVVVKMVSLAAQKFLTDLSKESYAYSKKRQATQVQQTQKASRRNVLLLEDVSRAARKFGVHVTKPEYLADNPSAGIGDSLVTGAGGSGGGGVVMGSGGVVLASQQQQQGGQAGQSGLPSHLQMQQQQAGGVAGGEKKSGPGRKKKKN